MKNWIVDPKLRALVLEPSGATMQRSCNHRAGRKPLAACGGCYGRAIEALSAIEKDPRRAKVIVGQVFGAIQNDSLSTAATKVGED